MSVKVISETTKRTGMIQRNRRAIYPIISIPLPVADADTKVRMIPGPGSRGVLGPGCLGAGRAGPQLQTKACAALV